MKLIFRVNDEIQELPICRLNRGAQSMMIAEKIARAGNSSNLRVVEGLETDADVLIACGWTPTALGRLLSQLQSEWDGCAKPLAITSTEAKLLFGSLKSLNKVVSIVEDWATRKGIAEPPKLAISVVAYWLAPICRPCLGRGFERVPGTPKLGKTCNVCAGSREGPVPMGEAGRKALSVMDGCYTYSMQSVKKRLRN